jgi:hypothetical protein
MEGKLAAGLVDMDAGAQVGPHGPEDEGGDALFPGSGLGRQPSKERSRQLQPNRSDSGGHEQ